MGLLKSRLGALALVLGMVVVYVATQIEIQGDPRPVGRVEDIRALAEREDLNVFFIVIDTLRADRLGAYGYERDTSPGMDYLAETGALFTSNWAQSSWTKSSMASLWTGLYPDRTGVRRYPDAMADEARMPAEILREHGFLTAGIWRNGWVAPNFNFQQGFDLYQNPHIRQAPASLRREARAGRIDGTDIDLVFSVIEFLRVHADERFFLYAHLMDVHQYVTVDELSIFGTTYSDFYDNSILWVDKQVRALYGALDQFGLRDKTLVVITSDHGEAFGEHGAEGHARDLHPEVTQTPFIISFPFRLAEGIAIDARTQNVDVWPTILDLLGLPVPEGMDGRSRRPEILGERPAPQEPEAADVEVAYLDRSWGRLDAEPDPILALRSGRFRIVYPVEDPEKSALFDLESDPYEQRQLPADHAQSVRLQELAQRELDRGVAWEGGAPSVKLDDMSLRQLRALGYVLE